MRAIILATAVIALAGCDSLGDLGGGGVSTNVQVANNYRQIDYRLAGENRDMHVIVTGAVPGADSATLQQTTLAAMQRKATMTTRFTATPQNANRAYKTVLVFNGPTNLQASALCRDPQQSIAPAVNVELRLQAVFCLNDQFLTEVYSRVAGGNSLGNKSFDALIGETMTALYETTREIQRDVP